MMRNFDVWRGNARLLEVALLSFTFSVALPAWAGELQQAGPAPADPIAEAPLASVPPPPREPRERSTVSFARLDACFWYVRGDKRLGVGTLSGYHVVMPHFGLDVARFPYERVGFEIHVHGGPIGVDENASAEIGFSLAGLAAPFRWKGRAPGSVVLGVGGTFEFGRPVWTEPGYHAAPFGLLRFRLFPNETIGLQTTYRYVPITTDELWVQEHDLEVGVSYGLLQFGLRGRVDEARGGIPGRLYRSFGIGTFVGLAVF